MNLNLSSSVNRAVFLFPSLFYLLVRIRCRGFFCDFIWSHSDTHQSVGLLWTTDRPVAETSTWQHKHSQETNITPPVGFEPTIPAIARLQTYALDRAVTGIGPRNIQGAKICFILLFYTRTLTQRRICIKVSLSSHEADQLQKLITFLFYKI
jgi:hypothetical protein